MSDSSRHTKKKTYIRWTPNYGFTVKDFPERREIEVTILNDSSNDIVKTEDET